MNPFILVDETVNLVNETNHVRHVDGWYAWIERREHEFMRRTPGFLDHTKKLYESLDNKTLGCAYALEAEIALYEALSALHWQHVAGMVATGRAIALAIKALRWCERYGAKGVSDKASGLIQNIIAPEV